MKKMMLILIFLLLNVCVFADKSIFFSGMGLLTNRSFIVSSDGSNMMNYSINMSGINITNFVGKGLGLFVSNSLLLSNHMASEVNGISNSYLLDIYNNINIGIDIPLSAPQKRVFSI